jgi:hypothetical protein
MNFSCQRIPFLLTVLSLSSMLDPILIEAQPKGYNYEEAKVPKFNLAKQAAT